MMPAIRSPAARSLLLLVLLGCVGAGSPWAAARAVADPARDGVVQGTPPVNAPLERRIVRLHAVLQITKAQDGVWRTFADTLRRNTARSVAVDDAWRQRGRSANAVDELELYGAIADADAQNARDLLTPFRTLYDALTPGQKRTADGLVRHYVDQQTRQRP